MARRRRRRRKRRDEGAAFRGAAFRVAAIFARVALVVLVSVAVGYAFYLALSWVADSAERRDSASPTTTTASAAFAGAG